MFVPPFTVKDIIDVAVINEFVQVITYVPPAAVVSAEVVMIPAPPDAVTAFAASVPFTLVNVKLVAVATPNTGVTSVGDVASTTDPEPVTVLPRTVIVPVASGKVQVLFALVAAFVNVLTWLATLLVAIN